MAGWMRRCGGVFLVTAAVPGGLGVFWAICRTGACRYGRSLAGPGLAAGGVLVAGLIIGGLLLRADGRLLRITGAVVMAAALPVGAGVAFASGRILCNPSCVGDYMLLAMGAVAAGVLLAVALLVAGGVFRWAGRDSPGGEEDVSSGEYLGG
ncbi:MAG: hypothetical protein JW785_00620 [Acidimicrobiia bacterium]|nr:hypothetical protein [Acidimicrobiia bacterium]